MTTKPSVAVIDYGMGNLHSVESALAHVCDHDIWVTSDPDVVAKADRVLFPGVGAIGDCMSEIRRLEFDQLLQEQIATGKPVLCICVGMQALMTSSEENNGVVCIDVLPGSVRFFGHDLKDEKGNVLKVPHMGWNQVGQHQHSLWKGIPQNSRFYFVHSYYVEAANSSQVLATCDYGLEFCAAIGEKNLFAVQFHPEKSHTAGLQLLHNFVRWNGEP